MHVKKSIKLEKLYFGPNFKTKFFPKNSFRLILKLYVAVTSCRK